MDDLSKFAAAFVAAQADMGHAPFDSNNPHFKSRFASLRSVLDTVRPVLAAKGIAVLQRVSGDAVETTLLHTSGQSISDSCPIVTDRAGPQALGSAITYARRYGLAAICGISADEDDDANGAEKATGNQHAAPAEERKPAPKAAALPVYCVTCQNIGGLCDFHKKPAPKAAPAPQSSGGDEWRPAQPARFRGTCSECGEWYEEGDPTQWNGLRKPDARNRHADCMGSLIDDVAEVMGGKVSKVVGAGPDDDDIPF